MKSMLSRSEPSSHCYANYSRTMRQSILDIFWTRTLTLYAGRNTEAVVSAAYRSAPGSFFPHFAAYPEPFDKKQTTQGALCAQRFGDAICAHISTQPLRQSYFHHAMFYKNMIHRLEPITTITHLAFRARRASLASSSVLQKSRALSRRLRIAFATNY